MEGHGGAGRLRLQRNGIGRPGRFGGPDRGAHETERDDPNQRPSHDSPPVQREKRTGGPP